MFQDRDYQIAAEEAVWEYLCTKPGNPVIAMPVGTGKSVVIARFLKRLYSEYAPQRTMILTHVKELVKQNYQKLLGVWPLAPAGIFSAGLRKKDTTSQIIFGGIKSVANCPKDFGHVGIVIVDECDLISKKEGTVYQKFFSALKETNPHLRIIGLTGTPWRTLDGKITDAGIFDDICFDLTTIECFNWFLDEGYLCQLKPKPTNTKLDTDGVKMLGGDFVLSDLQKVVDQNHITYAALKEAFEVAGDREHWLIFCTGVEHTENVAKILTSMGIECGAVHNKRSDRDKIIADFKAGKLRAVANNNVLTTGFDYPHIDCILWLRPTASSRLWVQGNGRGTRPVYADGYSLTSAQERLAAIQASPKNDCLVLDFACNCPRLGPINDPVIPRLPGEKTGDAPVKICPACNTYNHASARQCIFCNHEFPQHGPAIKRTAGTDEIIKSELPIYETFAVNHITYNRHTKIGKPDSIRITYFCGMTRFQEFICPEHTDPTSRGKTRRWFYERTGEGPPTTVTEALSQCHKLLTPTHVRIWTNTRYPQVIASCFDGTNFGTQNASQNRPSAKIVQMKQKQLPKILDDDVPF